MAVVCPTVTPESLPQYNEQLNRLAPFAPRIHLDFMDGTLAPTVSPSLEAIDLPRGLAVDLHIMYQDPGLHLKRIVELKPDLVIIHAEADVDFDYFFKALKDSGIQRGLALLPETADTDVQALLPHVDHVLVFSGDLGHFGGTLDEQLFTKVVAIKNKFPGIEIGWDGGINANNAPSLVKAGVGVLNVGGFIQRADNPEAAYHTLLDAIK
jgi:ribulose-phosphate 3-epimerase